MLGHESSISVTICSDGDIGATMGQTEAGKQDPPTTRVPQTPVLFATIVAKSCPFDAIAKLGPFPTRAATTNRRHEVADCHQ
jgi:hypothetical protein